MTVRIDYAEFTTFNDLIASDEALDGSVEPVELADGLSRLGVVAGYDIDSLIDRLLLDSAIEDACPSFIDDTDSEIYLTNNLAVIFEPTTSRASIEGLMSQYELTLLDTLFGDYRFQILRATDAPLMQVLSTANEIYETGLANVSTPGFIYPFTTMGDPNDDYWEYQWHFKNTGQFGGTPDADIDLDLSADYYSPTTPFLVAVLDDGFEPHEDFAAGRIAGGYNYVGQNFDVAPFRDDAHGMATTGIIGAMSNNSTGISSFSSYNVKVIHQKIFHDGSSAGIDQIATAIDDAIALGANLISNSWGRSDGFCYPIAVFDAALDRANDAGVVVVFSSGNRGQDRSNVNYPACHETVIAVGATDSTDNRWYYSQYGVPLDVTAPSARTGLQGHFWTLDQMGSDGYNDGSESCLTQDMNYTCRFGGTSAACPQVSGIAMKLMLRRPDLIGNPDRIRRIIRLSAEREQYGVSDTVRVNNYVGWGRVNADRAMLAVTRGDANNNGVIDIDDITYLIAYCFQGGPAPQPRVLNGDANCSGYVDVDDWVYLIAYIFQGGPEPPDCFNYTDYDPD